MQQYLHQSFAKIGQDLASFSVGSQTGFLNCLDQLLKDLNTLSNGAEANGDYSAYSTLQEAIQVFSSLKTVSSSD
jgi:hypothetical protein